MSKLETQVHTLEDDKEELLAEVSLDLWYVLIVCALGYLLCNEPSIEDFPLHRKKNILTA